ncbi:hypothetical protein YPPY03_4376, partial [Yersinia pestis PY-03]
MRQTRRPYRV